MFDIILTSTNLTTVASIITISYFTKDIIKFIIEMIKTYVIYLKNEVTKQLKSQISEAINEKSNLLNDKDNDSIHEYFEDIPARIPEKKVDTIEPLVGLRRKAGDSVHSQQASASLFPEKVNNANFIGATGEYHETPIGFGGNELVSKFDLDKIQYFPQEPNNNFTRLTRQDNMFHQPFYAKSPFIDYPRIHKSVNNYANEPVNDCINTKPVNNSHINSNNSSSHIPIYNPGHIQKLNNKTVGLLKKKNNLLNENLQQYTSNNIEPLHNVEPLHNIEPFKNNDLSVNFNCDVSQWMMSTGLNDINKLPLHDIRGEIKSF